jgi:alanine racemase
MDQTTIDLSAIPAACEGDEVVLIGRQGTEEVTTEELAKIAGTISYEILCGLSDRVPRHYVREGRRLEVHTLLGQFPQ